MEPRLAAALVLLCAGGSGAQEIQARYDDDDLDYSAGKRTFLFGKLVLVPVLAALGLKFLALLPIVLTKIALLSLMNFLSTNLNLLVSTLFGLKNFLGKHGLWAQEDTKRHPELETFAEWANQPLALQPSVRYQYVLENELATTKAPAMLGVFDRRVRDNDWRRLPKRSGGDQGGKYRCYWTDGRQDGGMQLGEFGQENLAKKRKFDVADAPRIEPIDYGGQTNVYGGDNLLQPLASPNFPGGQWPASTGHRQVATRAANGQGNSGIRDADEEQLAPFTRAE